MKILRGVIRLKRTLCNCTVSICFLLLGLYGSNLAANHLIENPVQTVYGLWQVSDKKYCVYDCDTYNRDYDPGIGRILSFSSTQADNGEDNCTNVNYLVRYIDRDAWKIEEIFGGKQVEIAEKHIPTVTLFCGVKSERWDKFGTWITFLNPDTILISFRGYAIQAKRI